MKSVITMRAVTSSRALTFAASAMAVCLLSTASSFAAPGAKDRQKAAQLAAEAKKLVQAGDLQKAVAKLKNAEQLAPQPAYELEIGKLEADLGDFVAALASLERASSAKPTNAVDKRAQAEAKKLFAALEARTPKLTIEVFKPEASKVTVTLDDEDVEIGEHPVNPGKHEVVAKAKGYGKWQRSVRLDEGESKSVEITLKRLGDEGDEEGGSGKSTGVPKWAAWTTWGLTTVAVGVGAGFGIMAIQTTNQVLADYGCENGKCPPSAAGDLDIAKFNGNVSTAGFAIGGVGLVTASVLSVMAFKKPAEKVESDKESGESEERVEARPLLGPGYVGVVGSF